MRILEVGAGTGAITDVIADQLIEGDRLDVIELEPELAVILRSKLNESGSMHRHSEKIKIFETDIRHFFSDQNYNVIVCALPFNSFSIELIEAIFQRMQDLTARGGQILFFEYLFVRRLKQSLIFSRYQREAIAVSHFIDGLARQFEVASQLVLANIPPARIYRVVVQEKSNSKI